MRWILPTVAVLSAALLQGSARADVQDPPPRRSAVSPATVVRSLDPGGSTTVDKTVTTPAVPPKPDVVLLVDGTASMAESIKNVKRNLSAVTASVRAAQPDSRFAVATYRDATDGHRAFEVLQPFTTDEKRIQHGVDELNVLGGLGSGGPAEDWINALFQISQGFSGPADGPPGPVEGPAGHGGEYPVGPVGARAEDQLLFRAGATPIVVLVGDASSHDPSLGHSLADTTAALAARHIRVVAVDVDSELGDGLNGNGDPRPIHYPCGRILLPRCDQPHPPNQATAVVQATGGTLLQGVDPSAVSTAIATGLTNLPATVTHRLVDCDPRLTVSLDPESRTVTSGTDAHFTETIATRADAPVKGTLSCAVQFTLNAGREDDPALRETIRITVSDPTAPSVTPRTVIRVVDPGGSTTVDKTISTRVVPPRPDVVLLVDGTASMADTIANVRENLATITGQVGDAQPDSRFSVATYGDAVDGERAFQVLQPFTNDPKALQGGVDALTADRGTGSGGPAEDWINALVQISQGANGDTAFRAGASPVVVLVGDASSHDPSLEHTLAEATAALVGQHIRVLAVDVATAIGDGLDGNGDGRPVNYPCGGRGQPACDPLHAPGEATTVVRATGGSLFEEIDPTRVADTIAAGLTNLPVAVTHRLVDCDPNLTVTLDPQASNPVSGDNARFTETVRVAPNAPQGRLLRCTVQFTIGEGDGDDDPDLRETITIGVKDRTPPVVTVDDRTAVAAGPTGAVVTYPATARDNVNGALVPVCTPPSGSRFPVGTTTVRCVARDQAGNTGVDTAVITVLPPPPSNGPTPPPAANLGITAAVTPNPAFVGGPATATFTVTNAGPQTATGVVVDTALPRPGDPTRVTIGLLSACTPAAPCTLAPGGRITLTQRVSYQSAVTGTVRGNVASRQSDPVRANNTATTRLTVLQPTLTLTPTVGPPGLVVQALGSNFPPGTTVALRWQPGITALQTPVVVRPDRTFQVGVLILRKDQLGPRMLRASGPGYTPVQAPLLVVPRFLEPPEFAGRG